MSLHQNYHFLIHLAQDLDNLLKNSELLSCFSQNKDEIIIGFAKPNEDFYLRATLQSDFACLNTLEQYQRAKKNTIDLFQAALFRKVEKVAVFENDRALGIFLEQNFTLVFKLHGKRANLLLFEGEEVVDIFHKKLENDHTLKLSAIARPIKQDKESFLAENGNIKKLFPTFDKTLINSIQGESMEEQWQSIEKLLLRLNQKEFWVGSMAGISSLHFFGELFSEAQKYTSALEALNAFYYEYTKKSIFEKEQQQAFKKIEKNIQKTENYLQKTFEKLAELSESKDLEKIGHILMANLHQIPPKAEEIELYNFYTNKNIKIKLKTDLSSQKNAEWYYKKAKNQKIELAKLEENLEARQLHLSTLKNHLGNLQKIDNLKELRSFLKKNALTWDEEKDNSTLPFKVFDIEGFTVLIGKNAQNNDLLTQKYTYKEDLWLHAKDVSGSHVVIKYQAGKIFSKSVIEKAAALAAYFSKRRNESLCPVIYTPKKFVRKTKDLQAGQVIVEKENVLMIEPTLQI
ncbi:MAG: NFACT RNA binding domain-containing protein [Thermonemataceae bacterium]|nr:NFACT RNA binding domain-containing protein [Thermonemataceae bacterium]